MYAASSRSLAKGLDQAGPGKVLLQMNVDPAGVSAVRDHSQEVIGNRQVAHANDVCVLFLESSDDHINQTGILQPPAGHAQGHALELLHKFGKGTLIAGLGPDNIIAVSAETAMCHRCMQ